MNCSVVLYSQKHLKLLVLLGLLLCSTLLRAASSSDELMRLEALMLKYIGTNERDTFFVITEQLKEAATKEGDDRLFHKAWSNQALFEAAHQYYASAMDICQQMKKHAQEQGCVYGEYSSLHTEAMVLLQRQQYDAAEKAFLNAVDFHHRRFPNESAAEDLRELMKIAYTRGNMELAKKYANQLLAEPNLAPHHKGRTLYRLSIMAFDENDADEFNHIYDEMKRLEQTDGIRMQGVLTEVNFYIVNGDYKSALRLSDRLSPDTCAERKALIYHRLGDDAKAYEYMLQYKNISDSIARASHNSEVANLYLRMNNDRLRLEQELLENQNGKLRYRFYIAVALLVILILLFVIYQRRKIIRLLKHDNTMLDYGKKGAERALKELNELSFYESKADLSLTTPVRVNKLCDHLANIAQNNCDKGVTTVFQTDYPDDFEIKSNPEALEKLLALLLNNSARFAQEGLIRLRCADAGAFVLLSITDATSRYGDDPGNLSGGVKADDDGVRYVNVNFNICQSISRLLHGRIWYDAEYTGGTRFYFEVPKEP